MKKIVFVFFSCIALIGNSQECISGDCENGQGIKIYKNGDKYEGEFKDGKADGQGIKIWNYGDMYEGEWKDASFNGYGTYIWKNGDKYEGEWKDGLLHGHGAYIWKDGTKYEGQWKNDKEHGQGIKIWKDGGKYEGEWKDGNKHGHGTSIFMGVKYEGEWRNDKINGKGIKIWKNGDKYEGEWKDYKMHGQGVYYWKDGDKYEGQWKNAKEHGQGQLLQFSTGTKFQGKFRNGKFINGEETEIKKLDSSDQIEKKIETPQTSMLETEPSFPGGTANLFKFLINNIKYPQEALEKKIGGKVYLSFVVNTDGSIEDIKVQKGVHLLLDNEAIRVVNSMPKWNPGTQNGKKITSRYTLPINFRAK